MWFGLLFCINSEFVLEADFITLFYFKNFKSFPVTSFLSQSFVALKTNLMNYWSADHRVWVDNAYNC